MILFRVTMIVIPEKQKEVFQTLLSLIEPPGPGNEYLSYGVYCDIKDNNTFSLFSEWELREHLDHHLASNRFGVLLGSRSLLCEPLNIQILTIEGSEGIEAVNSVRKKVAPPPIKTKGV